MVVDLSDLNRKMEALIDEGAGRMSKLRLQLSAIDEFKCPHCSAKPKQNCAKFKFGQLYFWRSWPPHDERYICAVLVYGDPQ